MSPSVSFRPRAGGRRASTRLDDQFFEAAEAYGGELFATRLTNDLEPVEALGVDPIGALFAGPFEVRVRCRSSPGPLTRPRDYDLLTLHPDLSVTSGCHDWDLVAEEFLTALGAEPSGCLAAALILRTGRIPAAWDWAEPTHRVQIAQWCTYRAAFSWAPRWAQNRDRFTREDRSTLLGLGVTAEEWDTWFGETDTTPARVTSRLRHRTEDRLHGLVGCEFCSVTPAPVRHVQARH